MSAGCVRAFVGLLVTLIVACLGCAHHPARMADARLLMAQEEYAGALKEVETACESEDDVLCLLERGLLLHYAGRYAESNEVFERAEVLTEDLYTKSLSRQAISLVTSDLALKYVPMPFEQVLVNYFRALNYMFLGEDEDALVECRKASQRLALYAEEDKRPYRQDAFIEYLTGVLYEWGGQTNDAAVSYRNAQAAYQTYSEVFGILAPPDLPCDLARTARAIGLESADSLEAAAAEACPDGASGLRPDLARVVVIIEQGFVPPRQEWSVAIPILKSEAADARRDPDLFSLGIAGRMHGDYIYDSEDLDYLLRIALPMYPDTPPTPQPMLWIDSVAQRPALCEDVGRLARIELEHDMPKIFARTLARAIVKYMLSEKAERRSWFVGAIADIFAASTEQADLRGWLSLPQAIYVTTVYLEPGAHTVAVRGQEVVMEARAGTSNFVRFRVYPGCVACER
jgi:hypothetical protein